MQAMLQELTIRNFAIIDDLRVGFSDGLTVLSGETGTGKSIIINAVNLLLGSRVSPGLVREGAEAAELEALFAVSPESPSARVIAGFDLDPGEGLLIRRVISRNDKHRVYINGRLATAQMLGTVTENLASISGQHAHQGLLKEDAHLEILDRFAGLSPLREKVAACFREMAPLIDELRSLRRLDGERQDQMSLLEFQKNDIDRVSPVPGEDETLEKERLRLKHAEMLLHTAQGGILDLYDGQGAAMEHLAGAAKALARAGEIDVDLLPITSVLTDLQYQLEDVVAALRSYAAGVQTDAGRLEAVEARMDALNRLKRKYGGDLAAVLAQRKEIEAALEGIENLAHRIEAAEKRLGGLHEKAAALARELSGERREAAERFSRQVERQLVDLKMAGTRFEVALTPAAAAKNTDRCLVVDGALLDETGMDRAAFMIAPNVGEATKPLSKIASGGELSRVMLALMAILAETESVGLVVFDEVDAGIGGEVAEMVGKKMVRLAGFHQILCITHLAQIAKFADHHYRISKHVVDGRTRTGIERLDEAQRTQEIARMLGGVTITDATLAHAREMLNQKTE
jgi:DNA repair protein RecN (Recombination protein N)